MKSSTKIERFEDLIVWQKAMELSKLIYQVTSIGAFSKDWGLRDQVRRASVSIPSNIAEGFERHSDRELRHYLNMAKGSAGEVRAQLTLARNLEYIPPLEAEILLQLCLEVSRMLAGYRRKVRGSGK